MTEQKIAAGVGLARRPGHVTVKNEIYRTFMRAIVWILFRAWIPLSWRQWALFVLPQKIRQAAPIRAMRTLVRTLFRAPYLQGASIGDTFENDLMKLIFNATAIANIADNAASSPLTNLEVALHTADPGDSGNQTTSEATYTSYARVPVARTSGGWTVTNNSVSPAATISFPAGTGGSGTITHFSIGTAHSGTGKILFSGTFTPNQATGNGITPQLTTATTITLD